MNLGKENEHTEHKRSTSELKEGIESAAAILNKHGCGTLYFGVRPKDGEIVGQDVSEKTLRDISQAFINSIEPRVIPSIECLTTEDAKDYIKVTFAGNERPYACDGRYRIRSADEDILMGRSTLRLLMQDERYRKSPWDREVSDRPLSDVDEDELRSFVERGRAKMRITFEYRSVEDTLSRLHLLKGGKLTNAADVLFCSSVGVQLKMGVFKTHERIEALDIRQESGTIFRLVDQAEYFIANNIRRRFVVDSERTREEVPEIPFAAIREAIINAYAHRIWYRPGYVQVDVYHDAVDIISPGWFIDGQNPADHLEGASSDSTTRNELIAQTLFRSGDIESSGMGIKKIKDLSDAAGVHVSYEEVPFGTKLTFHRPDPYADSSLGTKAVPSCSKLFQVDAKAALSNNERTALSFLEGHNSATAVEIAQAVGMTRRGTTKLLGRLITAGFVEIEGTQRTRRYRISR